MRPMSKNETSAIGLGYNKTMRWSAVVPAIALLSMGGSTVPAFAKDNKKDPTQIGDRNVSKGLNFYSLDQEMALGKQLSIEVQKQAKIVETHQRETPQRGAQHAFEARIVFDDKAGAGEVQPRPLNTLLRLQPNDGGFGKLLFSAQRRQMQPDTTGNKVTDREFHLRRPRTFRTLRL